MLRANLANAHRDVAQVPPPVDDELYRLAVPWDVATTTQNRMAGVVADRTALKRGQTVALYYWRIDRFTTEERILVQYWVLRGTRLDQTNAAAGIKPVEDGLFRSSWNNGEGIVPDDSRVWLETEKVEQLTARAWSRNEWVVVVVRRHPDQSYERERATCERRRHRPEPTEGQRAAWARMAHNQRRR